MVQARVILQWRTDRNLYVIYRFLPFSTTLNDP